ncbi:hypothetical protein [Streptomyces griseosporeus]|uniref:hypothetical protein n=1 Tax=Streptomyces griseosporeus TaxID=1910 RepID=UPI0037024E40
MATRTRKQTPSSTPAAAKKTTTKRTTPARKTTPRKPAPRLSLVKQPPALPARGRPWMTDTQGFAVLASRIAGINTPRIRDWRDHRDGTATRPLRDGSHLHYNTHTRTLTWQAVCPMGAIHEYVLDSPSTAAAARVHADRCNLPHTDLTRIPALTADELADLGLLHTPTWARNDLLGEPDTESIPVPLPAPTPRALGDQLTRSTVSAADTQPLNRDDIDAGLAARNEQPKEHPQP